MLLPNNLIIIPLLLELSNKFLIDWIKIATNNTTWNTINLPCAYTTRYYIAGSALVNNSSAHASTSSVNMRYSSTLTTLEYGTYQGNSNYGTMILCYGY